MVYEFDIFTGPRHNGRYQWAIYPKNVASPVKHGYEDDYEQARREAERQIAILVGEILVCDDCGTSDPAYEVTLGGPDDGDARCADCWVIYNHLCDYENMTTAEAAGLR